jgi:hypothetical protein
LLAIENGQLSDDQQLELSRLAKKYAKPELFQLL